MAELGPDLEDGESYLPSGMLLGEEGWAGRRVMPHRRQVPQRQSFFSDGVAGLPCYPRDFTPVSGELLPPPPATARANRLPAPQSLKPIDGFSASLSHFPVSLRLFPSRERRKRTLSPLASPLLEWPHFSCLQQGLDMGCVYSALVPEATSRYRSRGSGAPPAMGHLLVAPAAGVHPAGGDLAYPLKSGGCPPVRNSALVRSLAVISWTALLVSHGRLFHSLLGKLMGAFICDHRCPTRRRVKAVRG